VGQFEQSILGVIPQCHKLGIKIAVFPFFAVFVLFFGPVVNANNLNLPVNPSSVKAIEIHILENGVQGTWVTGENYPVLYWRIKMVGQGA
jgi:hypothetical protein